MHACQFDRGMSKRRGGGCLDKPAEPVDVYRLLAVRTFVQADFPTGPVRYV